MPDLTRRDLLLLLTGAGIAVVFLPTEADAPEPPVRQMSRPARAPAWAQPRYNWGGETRDA